uniref:Uncharacterized protein n=1 Tax=viral metagenome TaxID=1070528 RepID=A0A6C0LGR8_9ZZZZ
MNIQDNAQKSSSSLDYYKELKGVKKEIEKIHKQLSKDESLPEMIDVIQNKYLNNYITFILTNLSKPNSHYKGFDTNIIKILNIIITLLKDFTAYKNDIEKNEGILKELKESKNDYQKINNSKIYKKSFEEVSKSSANIQGGPVTEIIKHIYIYEYFKYFFESSDNTEAFSEIDNDIKIEKAKESPNKDILKTLNDKKIETDKEGYKNLFNYIQITSFDIFEYVNQRYTSLTTDDPKDTKDTKAKKEKELEAKNLIEEFKKEIYYSFININNTQGIDSESQLYENGNERIDLEARKGLLEKLKESLDKQLNNLNNVIKFIINSNKQEYLKEITDIQKEFKDYDNEKEYKDNILSIIVNEEREVKTQLDKNSNHKKILTDKVEQDRMRLQRDLDIGVGTRGTGTRGGRRKKMSGGERKTNKHYEDKYKQLKALIIVIDNLINKIANTEGKDDADKDPFSKKNGMFGDSNDGFHSIYNNIWDDYKKEMSKIKSKGVTMDSLKQDRRLYERVKENNLDPQDVLKINFQDKVIFICIVLIIRTFAMVLIELLIEYNFVSTLSRGIIVYSLLYLLLLFTSVLIINYDSYKLRILVNYLNVHINSSNIFFHILLFSLFIGLILIIINDDDKSLKSIDNIFNYTYVYKYIYEIAEKSNPESNLLLSQKEKLKLQYRMDIVTMIIFIFSSLLILIM